MSALCENPVVLHQFPRGGRRYAPQPGRRSRGFDSRLWRKGYGARGVLEPLPLIFCNASLAGKGEEIEMRRVPRLPRTNHFCELRGGLRA